MLRRALLLLLLAAPIHASGITSFEPDSGRDRRHFDREEMVETPIWYGTTVSFGSVHEQGWRGLGNAPNGFSGVGLGVTWPWRSRLQGFSEWSYGVRRRNEEYARQWWDGSKYVPFVENFEQRSEMFTGRSGVEYRFGVRGRPWCTVGAGVGLGLSFDRDDPGAVPELLGRVTCFTYPSGHTRLGLMLSGGPVWLVQPPSVYTVFGGSTDSRGGAYTHIELSLRIESRLRFPKANAD